MPSETENSEQTLRDRRVEERATAGCRASTDNNRTRVRRNTRGTTVAITFDRLSSEVRCKQQQSLPYTSAEARPMLQRYIGQTAPHTAFSCGEQVPDVAIPHYRDARMQHSQNR